MKCIDGLIRIGGGPQSRREVEMFRTLHPSSELDRRLIEEEVAWFGQ